MAAGYKRPPGPDLCQAARAVCPAFHVAACRVREPPLTPTGRSPLECQAALGTCALLCLCGTRFVDLLPRVELSSGRAARLRGPAPLGYTCAGHRLPSAFRQAAGPGQPPLFTPGDGVGGVSTASFSLQGTRDYCFVCDMTTPSISCLCFPSSVPLHSSLTVFWTDSQSICHRQVSLSRSPKGLSGASAGSSDSREGKSGRPLRRPAFSRWKQWAKPTQSITLLILGFIWEEFLCHNNVESYQRLTFVQTTFQFYNGPRIIHEHNNFL